MVTVILLLSMQKCNRRQQVCEMTSVDCNPILLHGYGLAFVNKEGNAR